MRRHKITAILLALTLGGCLYGCGDEGNLTAEVSEKQHSSAKMDSEFGMAGLRTKSWT